MLYGDVKIQNYDSELIPERPTTTYANMPKRLQKIDEFPKARHLLKSQGSEHKNFTKLDSDLYPF